MRAALFVLLVAGCGGPSKPAPVPPTTPPSNAETAPVAALAPATTAQVCKRVVELAAQNCGQFASLNMKEPECIAELDRAGDNPMLKAFTTCVVQSSCEEVKNCLTAESQKAATAEPTHLRACADTSSMDPVGLPAADWAVRNGAAAKKFSDAKSTKAKPIEMCGIGQENDWLAQLSCNNGSKPAGVDPESKKPTAWFPELSRVGNVGNGGRCQSIVDEYQVVCPEATYDIFVDAYVCPIK